MADRRVLLLVVSLIVAFTGGLGVTLLIVANNDAARQRDLCALVAVFDDPSAAPPTTERGRQQRDAMRAYREHRC